MSLQSLMTVGKRAIAQNDRNEILMIWVKKISNYSSQKLEKKSIFGPKKDQKRLKIEIF